MSTEPAQLHTDGDDARKGRSGRPGRMPGWMDRIIGTPPLSRDPTTAHGFTRAQAQTGQESTVIEARCWAWAWRGEQLAPDDGPRQAGSKSNPRVLRRRRSSQGGRID